MKEYAIHWRHYGSSPATTVTIVLAMDESDAKRASNHKIGFPVSVEKIEIYY